MGKRKEITTKIQNLLWGRAAGRCEFEGCNCNLTCDELTKDTENEGQIAHIIAASENGPRGNQDSVTLQDKIENLMLLCPEHHKLIDGDNRTKYTVECLLDMKRKHESRVQLASGISPNKQSLLVIYTARIGTHMPSINIKDAYEAMFPTFYPLSNFLVNLSQNLPFTDNEDNYWKTEYWSLERKFKDTLKPQIERGIPNISLFAIAPQPLLVYLGTLIGDIQKVSVYQKHREPDTWCWLDMETDNDFIIKEPLSKNGSPILVFALSAKNIEQRISQLYNSGESIWVITCNEPHNDMLVSPKQLSSFRTIVRKVLDDINSLSPNEPIKIHMAMPNSCAIELGRVRMPKADREWILYDYHRDSNSELETITIQ